VEPRIDQTGDFVGFVEKVLDTAEAVAYRVRAGKWPKVRWREEPGHYPDQSATDLPEYLRWRYGPATLVLNLYEDREPNRGGLVMFFDAAADGAWFVSTEKRCVWAILLKRVPPPFTGSE